MKKVLPILGAAAIAVILFTSCGGKQTADQSNAISTVDTAGLAQFEAFKKQQEFAAQYAAYQATMAMNAPKKSSSTVNKSKQTTGSMNTSTSYPAKTAEKKKGWSKAAKGAVIGGASGAVLGGVLYKKNRALGAVIGGVVGAAGGYGIGRHMDKKAEGK